MDIHQAKPLLANQENITNDGGRTKILGNNNNKIKDPTYLKRFRESPQQIVQQQQKKKKSFGANITVNKENELIIDPTRTIETKIKNIKISQKNDTRTMKAMKNRQNLDRKQQQQHQQQSQPQPIKAITFKDYYVPPKNLPDDVVDFDATQLDNINSEPIYAYEIFEYLREKEKSTRCMKYMHQQSEISPKMRAILVDWLVDVQQTFELNHETLYHAVKIIDHYLMHKSIKRHRLQLLGIVSLFISAKFEERLYPIIDDLLYITEDAYERDDIIQMEIDILQVLQFNINYPLSYSFLRRFARCSSQTIETLTLSRFILETSLMNYDFIEECDSKMAAASLLLALRMKYLQWNKTLDFYTGYQEKDLLELARSLNQMLKTESRQETIRNKYSDSVFFSVANIKPLDNI